MKDSMILSELPLRFAGRYSLSLLLSRWQLLLLSSSSSTSSSSSSISTRYNFIKTKWLESTGSTSDQSAYGPRRKKYAYVFNEVFELLINCRTRECSQTTSSISADRCRKSFRSANFVFGTWRCEQLQVVRTQCTYWNTRIARVAWWQISQCFKKKGVCYLCDSLLTSMCVNAVKSHIKFTSDTSNTKWQGFARNVFNSAFKKCGFPKCYSYYQFRSIIDYFNTNGIVLFFFVSVLGISKAFSAVNHFNVFFTLIKAGISLLLKDIKWYAKLSVAVRWNNCL